MPVIRNLSFPSIESRKFKKRPGDLHALQHCFSVPDNLQWDNTSEATKQDLKNTTSSAAMTSSKFKPSTNTVASSDSRVVVTQASSQSKAPTTQAAAQTCVSRSSSVTATYIFSHLFLGSESDVADKDLMSDKKITSVLNVSLSCARPDHLDDLHFKRIAVKDNYQENISPFLDEAIQFIELARENDERVLVHCVAGVSRSATVAIAYVMHYLRLPFEEAYRFVKEKRPTISPNFNFLGQLIEFEKELRDRGRVTAKASQPAKTTTMTSSSSVAMTCTTIKVTKMEQQTKVTKCDTPMPKSSFCRRRNGPSLSRPSYMYSTTTASDGGFLDNGSRGAGVILDLHVSVPANGSSGEQSLRRLGSDGVEDDNEGSQEDEYHHQSSFVMLNVRT